eukprot:3552848-Amphidinium_carterae.1
MWVNVAFSALRPQPFQQISKTCRLDSMYRFKRAQRAYSQADHSCSVHDVVIHWKTEDNGIETLLRVQGKCPQPA